MSLIQSCFNLVKSVDGKFKSPAQKKFIQSNVNDDTVKYIDRVNNKWNFVFDNEGVTHLYKNGTLSWNRGDAYFKKGEVKPIENYTEKQILEKFNQDFYNVFGIKPDIKSIVQLRDIISKGNLDSLNKSLQNSISVINLAQYTFIARYKDYCDQKYI